MTINRREFTAGTIAAGVVASGARAALAVVESDVTVKTADGMCDAVFVHPMMGEHPGVLIWPDALGLRPAFREMARRMAGDGFSVLVPNPFYRVAKAPVLGPDFSFDKPEDRAKLGPLVGSVTAPGAAERDAEAYVAFLDGHASVNKAAKIGANGYCMGGTLTMRTAAHLPNRVGAAGSFHGGTGQATDKPDSPHLTLVPKMKASYYFGISGDDDGKDLAVKDRLKAAFAAAKLPAEIEVYAEAKHGWCVPGSAVHHAEAADRAMNKLLALYKKALA